MIQDVLVSVGAAKALKAAGYPQESAPCYYNVEDDCVTTYAPLCVASGRVDILNAATRNELRANYIAVPTYAEALQWLDAQGVYVRIMPPHHGVDMWESSVYYADGYDMTINCFSRVDAANASIMNAANKLIEK